MGVGGCRAGEVGTSSAWESLPVSHVPLRGKLKVRRPNWIYCGRRGTERGLMKLEVLRRLSGIIRGRDVELRRGWQRSRCCREVFPLKHSRSLVVVIMQGSRRRCHRLPERELRVSRLSAARNHCLLRLSQTFAPLHVCCRRFIGRDCELVFFVPVLTCFRRVCLLHE